MIEFEKGEKIGVSACLLGCRTRYDGDSKPYEKVIGLVQKGVILIPLCPEQLGGLPTPRISSERRGNRVLSKEGVEVTEKFTRGAREALQLLELLGINKIILKARSPSCGSGQTYDGSFTGTLIERDGVFAEMCKKNGIKVFTEEEV